MQIHENADYEEFRKKVCNEYYALKSLTQAKSFPLKDLETAFRGHISGCFFIPFLRIIDPFGKRVIKKEFEKKNYTRFESQSEDILNRREIKEAVCAAFDHLPKRQIVTEDAFLKVFTATLAEKQLRDQFDIPLEPVLFAMVGCSIFSKGIQAFCDET